MRTFFWVFVVVKICVRFFLIRFYFNFKIFLIVYRFTMQFSLILFLTFSQILLYFSNNLSFIKKDLYLCHESLFYMHSFLEEIWRHSSNFFSIFVTNKIFKTFFTKRDIIRYYYFLNICIYQNRAFTLFKFLFCNFSITKFYIFLSIFIYAFKKFYFFN